MRVKTKLLIIGILILSSLSIAQWIWVRDNNQTPTSGIKIRGICAIPENRCEDWAVGEGGAVLRRYGNNEWIKQENIPNQTDYDFNAVFFINSCYGWIVGETKKSSPELYKGVVFFTTDGGQTWDPGRINSDLYFHTPFLKVRFANISRGYISCGNGIILESTNGGKDWSVTKSLPQSPIPDTSVYYYGLWVNQANPNEVWVSGDCFGLFARTSDGGINWETFIPDPFGGSNMGYDWRSGRPVEPWGERLANYQLGMIDYNQGYVGLGFGNAGYTNNGSWQRIEIEPTRSVWFTCVTDRTQYPFWLAGSYGTIDNLQSPTSFDHEYERGYTTLKSITYAGNDTMYAGGYGRGYQISENIYRRCLPVRLENNQPPALSVERYPPPNGPKARVTITWKAEIQSNISHWHIRRTRRNRLSRMSESYTCYREPYHESSEYKVEFDIDESEPAGVYYFQVVAETRDPCDNQIWWIYTNPPTWNINWLQGGGIIPDPPSDVTAQDWPDDNGERIRLTWQPGNNAAGYSIGRRLANRPDDPFIYIGNAGTECYYDDWTVVPGRLYEYRVLSYSATMTGIYLYHSVDPSPPSVTCASVNNSAPSGRVIYDWSKFDPSTRMLQMHWAEPSGSEPDIAAYFICPTSGPSYIPILNHSAPVDRLVGTWKVPANVASVNYQVASVDWSGIVSPWGPVRTFWVNIADYSSTPRATGLNNASKISYGQDRLNLIRDSNDTIRYSYTTDRGNYWSDIAELGNGEHPTIVQDANGELHTLWIRHDPPLDYPDTVQYPYPIPPPTPQSGTRSLMYSWTVNGAWQTSVTLYTDPNTGPGYFIAPCLVIDGNTIHVAFEQCHQNLMDYDWSLLYSSFTIGNPDITNWETVDSYHGFEQPVAGPPSMKTTTDGVLHLTWALNGEIRYGYRDFSGFSPIEVLNQDHLLGRDPSITVNGDEVDVVWSGGWETEEVNIYRIYRIWPWSTWGPIEQVSFTPTPSLFPVMVYNNIIWTENTGSDYEIYRAWPTDYGWSEPENVSNTPHLASIFGQAEIIFSGSFGIPESLFIVYTEKDNTFPYTIRYVKRSLSPDQNPLFSYNLGTRIKSPVTIERSCFSEYGSKPYQTVDTDPKQLTYRITGLNPGKTYAIGWDYYHKSNMTYQLRLSIDDTLITPAISVPSDKRVTNRIIIPQFCLFDGELKIKVAKVGSQGEAILSGFALFDITKSKGGGGGGQSAETRPMAEKINLYLKASSPFRSKTVIEYGIPEMGYINLRVYNSCGRMVRELTRGQARPGIYHILWDGRDSQGYDLSSGVYFYRLEWRDRILHRKLVLLR